MRIVLAAAAIVLLGACKHPQPAPAPPPKAAPVAKTTPPPPSIPSTGSGAPLTSAPPPPAANAVKVSLAEVGLEAASLDRTADPCVDFYQLACGGWIASNKIPDDRARWARFSEIEEKNKTALRTLLESAPAKSQIGDAYASCMDEAAIDKSGAATLKPLLDKARNVTAKDPKSFATALIALHQLGIPVIFSTSVGPDFHDSLANVTTFDPAGLGLPDRDYYFSPDLAPKLEAYRAHVAKVFELSASKTADAADVIAIETDLARLTKTGVERRDVPASYNPTDLKSLAKQTKQLVDWPTYFKALNYTPSKKIILSTPKFFAGLDALRTKYKPAQWASYFTYHALAATAFATSKALDDEQFALAHALTGVEKQPERWKRCVDSTTSLVGEALGKAYADKYFPPAARESAASLVAAIVSSLDTEISALDWMTDPTRKTARAKLAKIARMIGYPDKPKAYDFAIKRDDFAGNFLRASTFNTHRTLAHSGKPVDRTEWQMFSFTVNAYYEPTENNTALPAGILQPPFFGADRQVAANLGGIGMVIGHELTHGFDDQGAQFDADGNLKNWWTADDKKKFDDKAACVANQYSTFEALPKQFVNGKLTLGEDIADLGGVKVAYAAYKTLRKDATKTYIADGYSEDQQFFLAAGQAWCDRDRPAEIQRRLTVDVHAPPKFRVYGALRNLPEFAQAFGCAAGTPMRPTSSCSVW